MKSEMAVLRRRVEDLEDSLRNNGNKPQNGLSSGASLAPDSYSFPPAPIPGSYDAVASSSRLRPERPRLSRRLSSPGWGQERDKEGRPLPPQHQHLSESDNMNNGSSAPFDARLSTSATRLDPARVQHQHAANNGSIMKSPPQGYREYNHNNNHNPSGKLQQQQQIAYPPTPMSSNLQHAPVSRNGGDRPLSRQNSSLPIVNISGEPQRDHDSGAGRRVGSRRNSIVMSGPDGES